MAGVKKTPVLFVHGAGEGAHEADEKLAESLRRELGSDYDVRSPRMPDEGNPDFEAWRDYISDELAATGGETILIGHSFGGSVVLRYLVEGKAPKPLAAVFVVSAPFWGAKDWEFEELELPDGFASGLPTGLPVFLYHGREDGEVPFDHLSLYAQKIPTATVRGLKGRDHQMNNDLFEVARDIANGLDKHDDGGEVGDE